MYLDEVVEICTNMPHLGHVHAATTSAPQRRRTDWDQTAPRRPLLDRLRRQLRRRHAVRTMPDTVTSNRPPVPVRARPVMQIVRGDTSA
jgi:hypothetical protein